jgi:hypothetical protein
MRQFLPIVLTLILVACGAPQTPVQQIVTLPTGKQITVIGVGKIAFSNDAPALMLKYQTDLSLDDTQKLSQEADEIWATFHIDVEKAQLTTGIISANERTSGIVVTKNRGFNFVYKRGSEGAWSRIGP